MALTGKFIADFSDFQNAVAKADVSLKSLGDGASKVGPQLNRMVDQFSGRKLIQDAEVMTRAVEEVGGVSKLTAKELAGMGAKAAEAAEKMRALGMDVPPGLQKIADAAKPAAASTSLLSSSFASLTAAVSVGNLISKGVSALTSWTSAAIDSAGATVDLADKTGLSIETIQRMAYVADQTGTTLETFTNAAQKLGIKLDGGSASVRAAVKELGLEFQALQAQAPDAQFAAIVAALEKVEDPQTRARLALELFGKAGLEILPAIAQGYSKIADEAKVSSDAQIKSVDAASDAWARFKKNSGSAIVSFLGNVLLAADSMRDFTDAERAQQAAFMAAGEDYTTALVHVRNLRGDIMLTAEATKAAAPATEAYTAELARLTTIVSGLTKEQRGEIDAALKLGKGQEELEDKYGLTAAMLKIYGEQQSAAAKKSTEALAKHTAELKKNTDEAKKKAEAEQALIDKARAFEAGTKEASFALKDLTSIGVVAAVDPWVVSFNKLQLQVAEVETSTLDAVFQLKQLQSIGEHVEVTVPDIDTRGIGAKLKSSIGDLNDIMQRAFEGGGGIGGAIKSFATNTLSGVLSTIPVVGELLGQFAGAAVAAGQKIWGVLTKSEGKKTNDLRDAFVAAEGGLAALNAKAAEAGLTLDALLDANKPKAYEAAMKDLQAAFDLQADAMATLDETAQRYGFTIEELGPAFARQELDEQAQQLFKDWEVLNAAGIDTVAITTRMAEAVNAYVQHAVAMGTEVPEAMRPMLQQMVDMGTLTDASGHKITNLEDSGISFALTMSEGFKQLIDSVKTLTDAITRGLGGAVDDTSRKIGNIPRNVDVDVNYRETGHLPAAYEAPEGFATGTKGFRNFGAGTPVILHGWEAVIPRDQMSSAVPALLGESGGAAGGAPVVVHIDARGALFNDPGSDQRLAERVQQALDAKHGLTHKRRAA